MMEHAGLGGSYEVAPIYIPGVEKLLTGLSGVFAEINPGKSTWRFGAVRVGPSPLCMTNSVVMWNVNYLILIWNTNYNSCKEGMHGWRGVVIM